MPYLKKAPKIRTNTPNRTNRQKVYQSAKWKKLRESKLMVNPLCELCLLEGKITPAEDIHHKDSFINYEGNKRLEVAYDFDNLMSLCKQCHQKLHKNGTTHGFNEDEYLKQLKNQQK